MNIVPSMLPLDHHGRIIQVKFVWLILGQKTYYHVNIIILLMFNFFKVLTGIKIKKMGGLASMNAPIIPIIERLIFYNIYFYYTMQKIQSRLNGTNHRKLSFSTKKNSLIYQNIKYI